MEKNREITITQIIILGRYSRRDGYSPAEMKHESRATIRPFLSSQAEVEKAYGDINNLHFHLREIFSERWIFSIRNEKKSRGFG